MLPTARSVRLHRTELSVLIKFFRGNHVKNLSHVSKENRYIGKHVDFC